MSPAVRLHHLYVTSGLGLRIFRPLDFCCRVYKDFLGKTEMECSEKGWRMILKWTLGNNSGSFWIGFIWLMIFISGGVLWTVGSVKCRKFLNNTLLPTFYIHSRTIIPQKAKAVPLHAMKALRGRGVYLLLILDLSTRWGWVVRVTPRGKDPRYPLYRRLGRPQSRSGHRG
jgi:hypothetical protein